MKHWLSCSKFTIQVDTERGIITQAAPIARVFIGQKLENLVCWARARFGGATIKALERGLNDG